MDEQQLLANIKKTLEPYIKYRLKELKLPEITDIETFNNIIQYTLDIQIGNLTSSELDSDIREAYYEFLE